jgi:hypothetical protein
MRCGGVSERHIRCVGIMYAYGSGSNWRERAKAKEVTTLRACNGCIHPDLRLSGVWLAFKKMLRGCSCFVFTNTASFRT